MRDLYQIIKKYKEQGSCMLATVLEGENMGEKMFFCEGELIWQSKKGGFLEKYIDELAGVEESGMTSLEETKVFVEHFGGNNHLVICGAGHVSMAVIRIAKSIGFEVTVLEDRPSFADHARRAGADTVICDSFEAGLKKIPGSKRTYFVIVTRGHRYDMLCLKKILEKKNAYAGMMGSRRRVAIAKKQLEEEGISKELLDKIHTPIGLPIGAETPGEIAVSIMAEIIQCKNKKKQAEGYRDEILKAMDVKGTEGGSIVLAEIVYQRGSAPRDIGAKMVIRQDGTFTGTIGGGCMEAEIIRTARRMFADETAHCRMKKVELTTEIAEEEGMVCGGTQIVYMEKRSDA